MLGAVDWLRAVMRTLVVQIQTERLGAHHDLAALVERVVALEAGAEVERSYDDGAYVDVRLRSDDPARVWAELQRLLEEEPVLAAASIIVAEGQDGGWDEYHLLHHYDPSETTNPFP